MHTFPKDEVDDGVFVQAGLMGFLKRVIKRLALELGQRATHI